MILRDLVHMQSLAHAESTTLVSPETLLFDVTSYLSAKSSGTGETGRSGHLRADWFRGRAEIHANAEARWSLIDFFTRVHGPFSQGIAVSASQIVEDRPDVVPVSRNSSQVLLRHNPASEIRHGDAAYSDESEGRSSGTLGMSPDPAMGTDVRDNAGSEEADGEGEGGAQPAELDAALDQEEVEDAEDEDQNGGLGKEGRAAAGGDGDQIEVRGSARRRGETRGGFGNEVEVGDGLRREVYCGRSIGLKHNDDLVSTYPRIARGGVNVQSICGKWLWGNGFRGPAQVA